MIQTTIKKQKEYFQSGKTLDLDSRINNLKKLKSAIKKYETQILTALKRDLNKSPFEAYTNEVGFSLDSIGYTLKNLSKWAKTKSVQSPFHQVGTKSSITYVPYGTTLIIGPFNYPFQLVIEPLIGALAAGNTVVLKPSEYTTATESVLVEMIKTTFDEALVAIFTGDKEVITELIHSDFDYIFFTGSVPVGKIVMKAASEKLVPVTLELGGKSPTIVDETANIDIAAKRIAWGKFINAGQTCIAPDYVYVHKNVAENFKQSLVKHIKSFYGENAKESEDYGRIVSSRHHTRLIQLIDSDQVYYGGGYNVQDNYIQPTILDNIQWTDAVMSDEIFGPILPILTFENINEVIHVIINQPKPLALYLFSEDKRTISEVLSRVQFGGGAINDTISHVATPHLPFGGVGASGMGSYHGKYSFETFSHRRSLIKKTSRLDLKIVFPPYKKKLDLAKLLMK